MGANVGNLEFSRTGIDLQRTGDTFHALIAGAAVRSQLRLRRDSDFVADRNIMAQMGIIDMTDANIIPALLNGRIVLQPFHLTLGVSEPLGRLNMSGYLSLVGIAGVDLDTTRSGGHIKVHRSTDL